MPSVAGASILLPGGKGEAAAESGGESLVVDVVGVDGQHAVALHASRKRRLRIRRRALGGLHHHQDAHHPAVMARFACFLFSYLKLRTVRCLWTEQGLLSESQSSECLGRPTRRNRETREARDSQEGCYNHQSCQISEKEVIEACVPEKGCAHDY